MNQNYRGKLMKKKGIARILATIVIIGSMNTSFTYALENKHTGESSYAKIGKQKEELKSCYVSCLKLAEKEGLKNIVFCCISTGEFHFPNKLAAEIAVDTADRFLTGSKLERVVFNVFKEEDYNIYKKLFKKALL